MDFNGAAKVRVTQWITHNDLHQAEYEEFAQRAEQFASKEFAEHIREMVRLTAETTKCLRKSLHFLR